MWSNEELEQRKRDDAEAWERRESFEQNGGATKKRRKGHPTNLTPKKKKRKK
ncbi:hypothetical protein [Flavobacterium sp. 3-210]